MMGGSNAQSITPADFHQSQSTMAWLVRHCSPDLIVVDPVLSRVCGYQPHSSRERAGRTVMAWGRLLFKIHHRQNHGGLDVRDMSQA